MGDYFNQNWPFLPHWIYSQHHDHYEHFVCWFLLADSGKKKLVPVKSYDKDMPGYSVNLLLICSLYQPIFFIHLQLAASKNILAIQLYGPTKHHAFVSQPIGFVPIALNVSKECQLCLIERQYKSIKTRSLFPLNNTLYTNEGLQ